MSKKKAVLLFSGGQDSTTILGWCMQNYDEVYLLSFDYGQNHLVEIKAAKRIINKINKTFRKLKNKIKDNKLLEFLPNNNKPNIKWFNISAVNKELAKYYLKIHQGEGVSLTRVLTELHNGKFFGSIFTLILFISSLSLLFLTLSSFIFATNLFKSKKR